MRIMLLLSALALTGCANSQQIAQRHWMAIKGQGVSNSFATGVYTQTIQVNGQSFQVTQPYSR
jgi:hypothetical protein